MITIATSARREGKLELAVQIAKTEAAKGRMVTVVCPDVESVDRWKKDLTLDELRFIRFHIPHALRIA